MPVMSKPSLASSSVATPAPHPTSRKRDDDCEDDRDDGRDGSFAIVIPSTSLRQTLQKYGTRAALTSLNGASSASSQNPSSPSYMSKSICVAFSSGCGPLSRFRNCFGGSRKAVATAIAAAAVAANAVSVMALVAAGPLAAMVLGGATQQPTMFTSQMASKASTSS